MRSELNGEKCQRRKKLNLRFVDIKREQDYGVYRGDFDEIKRLKKVVAKIRRKLNRIYKKV